MGIYDKVTNVLDLPALIAYKYLRSPLNHRDELNETPELKRCYYFLDLTSRSFAAVIKELEGDLCACVCLFYLILRGLDTIEDDMTLDVDIKVLELRSFHEKLQIDGWTFDKSGPKEKDRQLLVEFHFVITEFKRLKKEYQLVITDITKKMGNGMADYILNADHNKYGISSLKDFDLYCHYVAGLVGQGLSRLFGVSEYESPNLAKELDLANHMGLFLQKTNIIRDYAEDLRDNRKFWPKEIWSLYATELSDFHKEILAGNSNKALACINHLVLNVLSHAPYVLDYLCLLRNQSVFNFCAIPQVMAIATLELVFNNPDVFIKNVKIRRGLTVKLIRSSTNPIVVAYTFRDFAHKIHSRLSSRDPNFIAISAAIARIDQWIEKHGFTSDGIARRVSLRQQGKRIASDGSIIEGDKTALTIQEKAEEEKFRNEMTLTVITSITVSVIIALVASILWRMWTFEEEKKGLWF